MVKDVSDNGFLYAPVKLHGGLLIYLRQHDMKHSFYSNNDYQTY